MSTPRHTEHVANYFAGYLYDHFNGIRHVRRVATWLGFLLKAIERLPAQEVGRFHSRQLAFTYRGRRFKVRYNHRIKPRGGIEFLELLPGRGAPNGKTAFTVSSLAEAE